ncbi:hypothetical protein BaRGS_00001350 [Batillaria attramentaria]|uniref:Uncharacterized protein n=1 Tax=Batillaria attramentaria TaxID=370345 RepID=A0ABD0M6R8_9CAEN
MCVSQRPTRTQPACAGVCHGPTNVTDVLDEEVQVHSLRARTETEEKTEIYRLSQRSVTPPPDLHRTRHPPLPAPAESDGYTEDLISQRGRSAGGKGFSAQPRQEDRVKQQQQKLDDHVMSLKPN